MASTLSTTYVSALYSNLLGFSDSAGATAWASQIDAGTSPYNVANAFLDSYQEAAFPVALLYQAAFDRLPDYAGFTYWLNNYKTVSAGNPFLLTQQFYNSTEFATKIGGDPTTLAEQVYVEALYQNVLGRPGDFTGESYWINWLTARQTELGGTDAAKDTARTELLQVFAQSTENVSNNGHDIQTYTVYTAFDGRAPTAAELTAAAAQAEIQTVTAVVSASPNYGATGAAPVPVFPLEVDSSAATVQEGNSLTFTVTLNTTALEDETYTFNINGATNAGITQAASSGDFATGTHSFTVKAGETTGTFTVTALSDGVSEPLEGFKVTVLDSDLNVWATSSILAIEDNTGGGTGQTFVLTTNQDNVVGTNADDAIYGAMRADSVADTLTTGDVVNGGAGTDSFYFSSDAPAKSALPTAAFSSIEKVFITDSTGSVGAYTPAYFGGTTSVQEMWNNASKAAVIFDFMTKAQTVGLKGDNASGAGVDTTVDYRTNLLATDAVTVALSGALDSLNAAGTFWTKSTELTFQATGGVNTPDSVTFTGDSGRVVLTDPGAAGAGLSKVYVNTTGNAWIALPAGDKISVVDSSAATGVVKVDASALVINTGLATTAKFTGGAANDTFIVKDGVISTLAGTVKVDGGAGANALVVLDAKIDTSTAATSAIATAINANVTNVQTLGMANAAMVLDRSAITNSAIVNFDFYDTVAGAAASTVTVTNFLGSDHLSLNPTVTDGTFGLVNLTPKLGETTLNLALNGSETKVVDASTGIAINNNLASINLSSNGTPGVGANKAIFTALADNATVKITGAQDLTLGDGKGAVGDQTKHASVGITLDGSAATGKLNLAGSASNDHLIGGSASDTLWLTAVNGTTKAADILTGNGGSDKFVWTAGAQSSFDTATKDAAALATITDFTSGVDVLQISTAGVCKGAPVFSTTKVDVSLATTLTDALNLASTTAVAADSAVRYFQYGGDTYVVVDNSVNTTFTTGTDWAIKLTGTVNLTATDIAFIA